MRRQEERVAQQPEATVIMKAQILDTKDQDRVTAGVPFVEALARRMAASMPHSIDLGDLVQDGMIGLIDASHRFDESRGIKFETFAERRVRGAMIDALRRDAWPRGIRRVRRELEAAREKLRHELGSEPSLADLAQHMGSDEARLGRTIVRINTIESTSPLATAESVNGANLPPMMVPAEMPSPDKACERGEVATRVRDAIKALPWRERKVIGLYYYGDVTMKKIGNEIGVNESRVSQLHARAVQRLRKMLGPDLQPEQVASVMRVAGRPTTGRPVLKMAKAQLSGGVRPARGRKAGRTLAAASSTPMPIAAAHS
jgi:RNA polymerase sigma factor for flagellar operon FliA